MKKIVFVLMIFTVVLLNTGAKFVIDAVKNAQLHNNLGINCFNENDYYCAIKEFEIAININPKTQTTAVYYANLGKTYDKIGYSKMAMDSYQKALNINPVNLDYYIKLAKTFKKQGILDSKLKFYKSKNGNPLNDVMVGLIYIEKGDISTGLTVLDNFCYKEPDILITKGIRNYISNKFYLEK